MGKRKPKPTRMYRRSGWNDHYGWTVSQHLDTGEAARYGEKVWTAVDITPGKVIEEVHVWGEDYDTDEECRVGIKGGHNDVEDQWIVGTKGHEPDEVKTISRHEIGVIRWGKHEERVALLEEFLALHDELEEILIGCDLHGDPENHDALVLRFREVREQLSR